MIRSTPFALSALLALAACDDSPPATDITEPCAPLRNVQDVVRVYGSAWNEPVAEERLCALKQSMTEDATYVDPTIDTANLPDLADAIGEFQTSAPQASIVQLSGLDARAGELRFTWEFQNDGASVITGADYMELAADGRIASIRGYWDPVPTEAPAGTLADYAAASRATDAAARQASLALAVASDVRFSSPDASTTGLEALAAEMERAGPMQVTASQAYPKFARVVFGDVTDYLHLGADGKIVRIARFAGSLPPL
jgi:hypothetical protein